MDELLRYFPDLSPAQRERFAAMGPLYAQWNAQINVISRQDTEHFYLHHVLHSLAIARVVDFAPGARILDAGTVRITFDSDVRAAIGSYDIFDPGLPALSVLEPGKLILEVKFTEMLPQLLRDVLPPPAAEFTAVSKYVLCYEKTRYMNGFEYWYET